MAKPLLSPRTMRSLRALAERAMQDSATFERPGEPIDNGRGSPNPGPAQLFTEACLFLEGTGDEDDAEDLRRAQAEARLWVRVAADVRETDTITSLTLNGVVLPGRWNIVYAPPPNALSPRRLLGITKGKG